MTWACDQIEARLSDYLEGMLTRPEAAEFEAHVEDCPDCAPLVASVKSLIGEMRSMEELEISPVLVNSILDQTIGPRERSAPLQGFWNLIRGLATPKFAYGMASVVATVVILLNAGGVSFRKPKLADLRPATIYRNMDRQAHLVYAHSVKYVSDLRVVYEIQSRLRQDTDLPVAPEERAPGKTQEQQPGKSDDHTRTQPRQQNRANELARTVELLAEECPVMFERSIR
jgi:anti-sigma factor RsiW